MSETEFQFQTGRQTKVISMLVIAAVAMRGFVALYTYAIGTDSRQFLLMTEHLYRAEFGPALELIYHPFYPLMSALAYAFVPDVETAATLVSVLFGSLTVVPLYWFTKECWGPRPAFITSLLYAFSPSFVDVQSDIMTEGLFLFLFFSSIAMLWRSLQTHRCTDYVLTAGVGAFAYLTRPEGIYIPVLVTVWTGIEAIREWRGQKRMPVPMISGFLLFVLVFSVLSFPYVLWVRHDLKVRHGVERWWFTTKGSAMIVEKFVKGEHTPDEEQDRKRGEWKERYGAFLGSTLFFAYSMVKASSWVPLIFLIVCMFFISRISITRRALLFMISIVVIYYIPVFIRLQAGEPLSTRYLLLGIMLLMPLAAIGYLEGFEWCWQKFFQRYGESRKRLVFVLILLAAIAGMLTRTVERRRYKEVSFCQAGEWMRTQLRPGESIVTSREKIAWYARADFLSVPRHFAEIRSRAELNKIEIGFIAVADDDLQNSRKIDPGFREQCEREFGPPRVFPETPSEAMKRVLVFRYKK